MQLRRSHEGDSVTTDQLNDIFQLLELTLTKPGKFLRLAEKEEGIKMDLAMIKTKLDGLVTEVETAISDIQNLNSELQTAIANEGSEDELMAISNEIDAATQKLAGALPAPVIPAATATP